MINHLRSWLYRRRYRRWVKRLADHWKQKAAKYERLYAKIPESRKVETATTASMDEQRRQQLMGILQDQQRRSQGRLPDSGSPLGSLWAGVVPGGLSGLLGGRR